MSSQNIQIDLRPLLSSPQLHPCSQSSNGFPNFEKLQFNRSYSVEETGLRIGVDVEPTLFLPNKKKTTERRCRIAADILFFLS